MTVVYARKIKTEQIPVLPLRRKLLSESARELLAYALEREFGLHASDYTEKKDENGKPYLEGCPVFFNISHSGEYVVCALSDAAVGVDIEKINPISIKVMLRFFGKAILSPREQMRIWTRYESYGKFAGIGIPHKTEDIPCFYREFEQIDKYFITVCSAKDDCSALVICDDDGAEKENDL